jgi:hypothetical protein
MICFCKTLKSYTCRACGQNKQWRKLGKMEKLELVSYKEKLENNTATIKDLIEIEKQNLDVTTIPVKYYL